MCVQVINYEGNMETEVYLNKTEYKARGNSTNKQNSGPEFPARRITFYNLTLPSFCDRYDPAQLKAAGSSR